METLCNLEIPKEMFLKCCLLTIPSSNSFRVWPSCKRIKNNKNADDPYWDLLMNKYPLPDLFGVQNASHCYHACILRCSVKYRIVRRLVLIFCFPLKWKIGFYKLCPSQSIWYIKYSQLSDEKEPEQYTRGSKITTYNATTITITIMTIIENGLVPWSLKVWRFFY